MSLFDKIRADKQKAKELPPEQAPLTGEMLSAQGQMIPGAVFEQRTEDHPSIITKETLSKAMETLRKYKAGKANMDRRIIENEQWWKMRHWDYFSEKGTTPLKTKSAWLVNVILSKHADAMDAYPEPNCLPREATDHPMAQMLSSIVPVVLEQNDFEITWSDNWWKKLESGFSVYGVFWDGTKLNGLGDIAIKKIDPLNIYWEPGISDIQKSANIFHVELQDNEALKMKYPQLQGKITGKNFSASKYLYDDNVDTNDKSPVIDWYYKKNVNGKDVLHYVKFINDQVLYATEDDYSPTTGEPMAVRGLYDHGLYPFFFDPLFPEEGTPGGFGYIDLCKDAQRQIDLMNNAIVANCVAAATPRWFRQGDGGINEEEFSDWTKPFVHVQGSLDDQFMREITIQPLSGNYLNILQTKIDEMKETSGNRDVNNGGTAAGVTAASAIAAMQEQSGKLSRDQIQNSYRTFRNVCYCTIELIRQFYDSTRQFRIMGPMGMQFIQFNNAAMQPVPQGTNEYGVDMGYRVPQYDIEVTAQKQSAYTKLSYNELAIQFFQLGFFSPQMADQALMALDMMDFKGKDEMRQKVQQNALMWQQAQLMAAMRGGSSIPTGDAKKPTETNQLGEPQKKYSNVEKAREQANASTQPR